jgi:hypothetical protein
VNAAFLKWVLLLAVAIVFTQANARVSDAPAVQESSAPAEAQPDTDSLAEQIFAYNVLSDVLKRSVDEVRFIDVLSGVLVTGQFAIYVLLFEKPKMAGALVFFDFALGIAALGILQTLFFVREAPRASEFARSFAISPSLTRTGLRQAFINDTARNELWKAIKIVLLSVSLALTICGLLAAAAENTVR